MAERRRCAARPLAMHPAGIGFGLSLVLGACFLGGPRPITDLKRVDAVEGAWAPLYQDTISAPRERLEHSRRLFRERGAVLSFWMVDDMPEKLRPRMRIQDHPCGETASAIVRQLPRQHDVLVGEWVLEIDEAGKALRRWPVPIDVMPRGVRGRELLLDTHVGGVLIAVTPKGKLRYVADDAAAGHGEEVPCPSITEFKGSDYLRCAVFRDGARARRLAFQAICS